jgi:hypothetical protein
MEAVPVVIAPILVGDEVPAYLMALDGAEQDANDDLRLLLTEHAATICGVILGRERVVAAAASQVRYDLLEGLLSGKGSEVNEVLRWARHLGYDSDREHRVLCVAPESEASDAELDDSSRRVLAAAERFFTTHAPDAISALRDHEVGQPEREAVDQSRPIGREVFKHFGQPQRRVDRAPALVAPGAVLGDALRHFLVEGLRRGDVAPRRRIPHHEMLGMAALARAGASDDEGQAPPALLLRQGSPAPHPRARRCAAGRSRRARPRLPRR